MQRMRAWAPKTAILRNVGIQTPLARFLRIFKADYFLNLTVYPRAMRVSRNFQRQIVTDGIVTSSPYFLT